MAFERIVAGQAIMAGVPCIRRTRVPVAMIVGLVVEGLTTAEIIADFPQLAVEDV